MTLIPETAEVQGFVDQLQRQLGNGFMVDDSVLTDEGTWSIKVVNTDLTDTAGSLSQLSVVVDLNGVIQTGSLKGQYNQFSVDANLLFTALHQSPLFDNDQQALGDMAKLTVNGMSGSTIHIEIYPTHYYKAYSDATTGTMALVQELYGVQLIVDQLQQQIGSGFMVDDSVLPDGNWLISVVDTKNYNGDPKVVAPGLYRS